MEVEALCSGALAERDCSVRDLMGRHPKEEARPPGVRCWSLVPFLAPVALLPLALAAALLRGHAPAFLDGEGGVAGAASARHPHSPAHRAPARTASPAPDAPALRGVSSMWCFVLMMPGGYEPTLILEQFGRRIGVFACDGYAVFSNDTAALAELRFDEAADGGGGRDLFTSPIGGPLQVQLGGKWHTAMNTEVFVRVWASVIRLGRFQQYHWTVKADPDTVFVPSRLRQLLATEPAGAVYLNNCRFGLHGPIEVLSRDAVSAYSRLSEACGDLVTDAMNTSNRGNDERHAFGEDKFLTLCLDAIGVRRVDELRLLLSEQACGHWSSNVSCDAGTVAFHPFKDVRRYRECWGTARRSAPTWEEALAAKHPVASWPGAIVAAADAPGNVRGK